VSVLLDENVEKQVLSYLRAEGYDGDHVVDALGSGAEDAADIAPYARKHDHVIVTKDTDFLAMSADEHAGVFFVENHRWSAYDITTAILQVVDAVPDRSYLRGVIFLDDWM
jgi:predicted nuclease of predicted toxin-antitoxin system